MITKTHVRPPRRIARTVRRILRNPRLEVMMSAVLFFIGLTEIIKEAYVLVLPAPDLHDGLLLLGVVSGLRGMVDVTEGIEHVTEAGDAHHKSAGVRQENSR